MFFANPKVTNPIVALLVTAALSLPISHALARDKVTEFSDFRGLNLGYNAAQLADYLGKHQYSIHWVLRNYSYDNQKTSQVIPVLSDGTEVLRLGLSIEQESWIAPNGHISRKAVEETAEKFSIRPPAGYVYDEYVFDDPGALPELRLTSFLFLPRFFEAQGVDYEAIGRALLDRYAFIDNTLYAYQEKGFSCASSHYCHIGLLETGELLKVSAPLANLFAWKIDVWIPRAEVRARWLEDVTPRFDAD